jgi:hypothetical protein
MSVWNMGSSSAYKNYPSSTFYDVSQVTVTAWVWVRVQALNTSYWSRSPGSSVSTWLLGTGAVSSNKFRFLFRNSSGVGTESLAPTTFVTDAWYHLAGTAGNGNVILYVNGELATSTAATTTMGAAAVDMRVLQRADGTQTANAFIHDVRLYNAVLTTDEILVLALGGELPSRRSSLKLSDPVILGQPERVKNAGQVVGNLTGAPPPTLIRRSPAIVLDRFSAPIASTPSLYFGSGTTQ